MQIKGINNKKTTRWTIDRVGSQLNLVDMSKNHFREPAHLEKKNNDHVSWPILNVLFLGGGREHHIHVMFIFQFVGKKDKDNRLLT